MGEQNIFELLLLSLPAVLTATEEINETTSKCGCRLVIEYMAI